MYPKFFSLGKTGKTNNNDAVTVTVDFFLSPEASWPCLHIRVHSFHALIAVSHFQVVFGTFIVAWVVLQSLEEKPGGI